MLLVLFFCFTFAPAKEGKALNLIIDIGNTMAKVALFDNNDMVEVLTESNHSLGCLAKLCAQYPIEQGIVATVIDLNEQVLADLAALSFPLLWLNHQTPLPVVNLYETPEKSEDCLCMFYRLWRGTDQSSTSSGRGRS